MALILTDQSGNSNTLTNSGATEYTATHPFVGSLEAVAFDGASQFMSATTSASLSPTLDITVRCWIKTTEGNTRVIVQNASFGAKYSGWVLQMRGGQVAFVICSDTGQSQGTHYDLATSSTFINDGNWHHVAGTYDGSNIRVYIDGNTTANATQPYANGLAYEATTYVRVGCENDTGANLNFCSIIGLTEIRVESDALNGAQNAADYNAQLVKPFASNLKAYWPFEAITASMSPSASASKSLSPSASLSPSQSLSPSASASKSLSPSASFSPSASQSPSTSASASASRSISASASPSIPPSLFTKQASGSLPTTKADLTTTYTPQEVIDVSTDDGIRVDMQGANNTYILHQYKIRHDNNHDTLNIEVDLQTTLAPSTSPVYLQIWNTRTQVWETLATDHTSLVNTDFKLTGVVSTNLTDYYDEVQDINF